MSKETTSELQILINEGKACPYCNKETEFVDSSVVYGKSYGMIYLCRPCKAYCGVHKDTNKSKGSLANAELRELRKKAHLYFDKIWKDKHLERNKAYQWLSERLGISRDECHIGLFDIKRCKDAIEICVIILNDLRRLDLDCGLDEPHPYIDLSEV